MRFSTTETINHSLFDAFDPQSHNTVMVAAYLTSYIEGTVLAMMVVDPSGTIVTANTQAARVFGYTCRQLCGESFEALITQRFQAKDPEAGVRFLTPSEVCGRHARGELFGLHKDGHEFPVILDFKLLETEAGRFLVGTVADCSEPQAADPERIQMPDTISQHTLLVN